MKMIQMYVDAMDDEIDGAKNYAEKYVECKAKGDMNKANRYKEMAGDELKHAMYQHEWAVAAIDEVPKVFKAPSAMEEAWTKAHKEYVEKVAWIKQMLAM